MDRRYLTFWMLLKIATHKIYTKGSVVNIFSGNIFENCINFHPEISINSSIFVYKSFENL